VSGLHCVTIADVQRHEIKKSQIRSGTKGQSRIPQIADGKAARTESSSHLMLTSAGEQRVHPVRCVHGTIAVELQTMRRVCQASGGVKITVQPATDDESYRNHCC
jgi:hypothetical protein